MPVGPGNDPCLLLTPDGQPIRHFPMKFAALAGTTTATPAGDRLFIDMILFCLQYVINLCTQSTSKIKSVSDLYVYISVVKLSRVT